jgi:hypothetical protein
MIGNFGLGGQIKLYPLNLIQQAFFGEEHVNATRIGRKLGGIEFHVRPE